MLWVFLRSQETQVVREKCKGVVIRDDSINIGRWRSRISRCRSQLVVEDVKLPLVDSATCDTLVRQSQQEICKIGVGWGCIRLERGRVVDYAL